MQADTNMEKRNSFIGASCTYTGVVSSRSCTYTGVVFSRFSPKRPTDQKALSQNILPGLLTQGQHKDKIVS